MNLTHQHSPAILCPPQHEVGICNPRYKGDNTPQLKAVFLCLPFFKSNMLDFVFIMTALFWRPLRSVVPLCDIANQLNAVTRLFAKSSDGFTTLSKGITA